MADATHLPTSGVRIDVVAMLDGAVATESHAGRYGAVTMLRGGRVLVTLFDAGRRPLRAFLYRRAEKVFVTWEYADG